MMKSKFASVTFQSLLGLLLLGHPLLAQGPLAPPGPPAPMMKTLQQMEPRTHIENAGYVITAPGSYYLTGNLNGGGTQNGIEVQASGVTIDLRGFSIVNCQVGLSAVAGVRSVAVANGSIRDCTGGGVDLSLAGRCRLEGLIVSSNAGDGASVGDASLVTLCTATDNGGRGLLLGNGGTVFRCVAQTNGNSGIALTSNCQATENTCMGNGSGAGQAGLLTTGTGNRVDGNSANQNNGQGFQINGTGNLVIRNNACGNSAADYTVAAGNNYGQIVASPGPAFVNSNAWANFGCGTQPNSCQSAMDCDDGNPCTTDSCEAGSCVNTPIVGCGDAVCGDYVVGVGEQCDDGNVVNGDGCSATCQTEGGGGVCTVDSECNDSNACTQDFCQGGTCVFLAQPNGTACNDGNACTVSDYCQNSACVGSPVNCDDGNACTTDSCNGMGGCVHTAIPGCGDAVCGDNVMAGGEQCDDGNLVNGDGCSATCQTEGGGGVCATDSECNDNNACTQDLCQGGTCVFVPKANGTACNDGNACTISDACQNSVCVGSPLICDDGNACTTDSCNGVGGCVHTAIPECGGGCVNGSTQACGTEVGACQAGTQTCSGGVWGACVGQVGPSAEICDNIDNNCDGMVDEGNPGGGSACNTGMLGACASGVTVCTGGGIVCVGSVSPSPETCDGLDNDCDGQVDEGGICSAVCGNGIVEAGETCDDFNNVNGDGCTAICTVQTGYSCAGSPSVCSDVDECATNTDGCSPNASCTNMPGSYSCACNAGYVGDGFTCVSAASCSDGIQNGSETGVDCGGGTCAVCAPGQGCLAASDCASNICLAGFCQ